MIRLAEGVYSWSDFNAEKKLNFNGFLVDCGGEIAIVDPPPMSEGDEAFFAKLGLKPSLVLVTNKHHLRDTLRWQQRFGAPLAMHESETNDYEFEVGRPLRDGDRLGSRGRVVYLPGKTPGEVGLLLEDAGVLILGDVLIGDPPGSLRWVPREKIMDPALLARSVRGLSGLPFDRLLLGDGEPVLEDAKAKVAAFLRTVG